MNSIQKALMNSSLRGIISDSEIAEIAEEIAEEIEIVIENETEKTKEEFEDRISDLEDEVKDLEDEIKGMKNLELEDGTLHRQMVCEWILENIKVLDEIYIKNIDLSKIVKSVPHKRIVLVGRAASGKDYMRNALEGKSYKYGVSYTTRPPRANENEGKDYFFLSVEKFEEMIKLNMFYEYVSFNGWYYGTTKEQFYNDDVFIMTPHGISHILPKDRKHTLVLFFDIPYEVRKERLMQRSDADTVERRLEADERDFANFTDYDVKITNPNF